MISILKKQFAVRPLYPNMFTAAYVVLSVLLMIGEVLSDQRLIMIFKTILIPALTLLYLTTCRSNNYIYLTALLMAWLSNVFLLSTDMSLLIYGGTSFLIYRVLIIILVFRFSNKFRLSAFLLASIPFGVFFMYVIELTKPSLASGFYSAIANAAVLSILAAVSLSNYLFEDNRRNSWLLISSLLFVVLTFLFLIMRFYIDNPVFRPLSALVFASAHYAFYRYLLLSEVVAEDEEF